MASEDAVMATNDDAAQCKRYAVDKGYWQDPYIALLVPKGKAGHAPEINKGYYARVTSIRVLIQKFLQVNFIVTIHMFVGNIVRQEKMLSSTLVTAEWKGPQFEIETAVWVCVCVCVCGPTDV